MNINSSKHVALVSPKGQKFGMHPRLSSFLQSNPYMKSFDLLWSGPNLGLLTLAAYFPKDWEVEYIDENLREIDWSIMYDIVFVSAMTQQAVRAYEIVEAYREMGILTVMGGIHATALPEEAEQYADCILVGEAEAVWPLFYEDYITGIVKKRYEPEKKQAIDLDSSRIPRYDLLVGYSYQIVTVQTTRGCPHNCSFCAASRVFGSEYRRKSNNRILREINEAKKYMPNALLLFADDNAFIYVSESIELLKEISKMSLRFIAQTDISISTKPELLEWLAYAGCQWVVIGFESVNPNSLAKLDEQHWKYKQASNYDKSIKDIQKYGINVYGTFIVGLDSDDEAIFESTAKFIIKNNLYGANITVPTPLPATRLREELLRSGRILHSDWKYYTLWDPVISWPNFTPDSIVDGIIRVYQTINSEDNIRRRLSFIRELSKKKRCRKFD